MKTQVINLDCSDGLKLKGLLSRDEAFSTTVIHIHGSCGNFYENEFVSIMRNKYIASGINFLAFNNRGHDCLAEAYKNGKVVYIGGSVENLSECIQDINAAISVCDEFSDRVVLQGHSFGCLKAIAYLHETKKYYDTILLSPADTLQLEKNYIYPRDLASVLTEVKELFLPNSHNLLPEEYFGIRQGNVEYSIPITLNSFIGLFENPLIELLNFKANLPFNIDASCFLYLGGSDALQTEPISNCHDYFRQRFSHLTFYEHPKGDHHFHGIENIVIDQIIEWIDH